LSEETRGASANLLTAIPVSVYALLNPLRSVINTVQLPGTSTATAIVFRVMTALREIADLALFHGSAS
jgi:hypothetical protein